MASTGERVASLGFALLVCLSLIGGGVAPSPVGTVAGQSADTEQCSTWDSLLYDLTTVGNINTDDENPCSAEYQRQQLADEWNETDADETRTQIHSQAGQLDAGNEQFLTAMDNSLVESDTISFSKGEAAAVEELANGGTVSEAQQAGNESITDYYTIKDDNLVGRWNVNAQTLETLHNRSENTTDVSGDFVTAGSIQQGDFAESFDQVEGQLYTDGSVEFSSIKQGTITLENGSSVTVYQIELALHYTTNGNPKTDYITYGPSGVVSAGPESGYDVSVDADNTIRIEYDSSSWAEVHVDSIRVRPTENLSSSTPLEFENYESTWSSIQGSSSQTQQETAVYINQSLGPAVEEGELDATDYISPSTLAQEYATEYKNSTSYVDATALAAYSGMSTPDLNNTASMTVTHDGTTYQGLLLSQNAPDAGWESGETYDPALISGVQLFAVAGDNGRVVELDGQFTIEEISGPSGDPISTADTVEVTYETANTSEDYAELQQQIRTLNEQIEEQKAQATSGGTDGGSSSGLLDQLAAALGVSVGAAIAVAVVAGLIAARIFAP